MQVLDKDTVTKEIVQASNGISRRGTGGISWGRKEWKPTNDLYDIERGRGWPMPPSRTPASSREAFS